MSDQGQSDARANAEISEEGSESLALAQQNLDERWTVPWAAVDVGVAPGEAVRNWHGREESVEIAGYTLAHPMLYTSDGNPADPETSCIDTMLNVGKPDSDGLLSGHWSSYAALSPVQRANYLKWIASGRRGPMRDINYAFLYFYGLERHALIDRGEPEEVLRVLMHLLKHYDSHPSFFSSASRLAAFLFATKGIEKLKPAWFKRLFVPRVTPLHHDSLAVALTWLYERKKPLPAALAFEVARQDIRCPHVGAYKEDLESFRALFEAAYTVAHGEGMLLQAAEAKRTWKYRPINPSLQSWEHFAKLWSVTAPDVLGAAAQFTSLGEIWRGCLGEAGVVASPWDTLVREYVNDAGRVSVPVKRLAELVGCASAPDGALTLHESLALVDAAKAVGFDLLPEPGLLLRPYGLSERLVLIRRVGEGCDDSDPYYLAGALLLALGSAMAAADGEVDHIEVLHISESVNSLYHFNDHDKQRLGVLRRRLLKDPPELALLTRRLHAILSAEERAEAAKFLVGVAGSNFTIGPEERRALRRAWRALDIPVAELEAILASLVPDAGTSEERNAVCRETLSRLMIETKHFAARMGEAMQEIRALEGDAAGKRGVWYGRAKAEEELEGGVAEDVRAPDPYRDGLYALLQRGDWSEAEFIALGEKEGVFVEGAMRSVDAWAREVSDDVSERMVLSAEGD